MTVGLGFSHSPALTAAPEAMLVKNINTTAFASPMQPVQDMMVAAGNRVFFRGSTPELGQELWTSDGTTKGSKLVKDIGPGYLGAHIQEITASGKQVFFTAMDKLHGRELWVSDGTPTGTRLVADLVSGPTGGAEQVTGMVAFRNGVAFFARSDWTPWGLWWTDGTESGTRFLRACSEANTDLAEPAAAVLGQQLYLSFGTAPQCLWKTDGTATGTQVIRETSGQPVNDRILGATSNAVYLRIWQESTGDELWKIDAKNPFPVLTKDINEGTEGSAPTKIQTSGDKAYFQAFTPAEGWEIWMTNGTETGTRRLNPDVEKPGMDPYSEMAVLGGNLITCDETRTAAHQLSTGAVTTLLESQEGQYQGGLKVQGGKVFFTVSDDTGRYYLHVSNGTPAGTKPLAPEVEVWAGDFPSQLTVAGSQVFFVGTLDEGLGYRLWKSNGTPQGTQEIPASVTGEAGSIPADAYISSTGILYFSADDGIHGRELWRSDGTPAGTLMVADLSLGAAGSVPSQFIEFNGFIYFTAETAGLGRELWRTDGTAAGTTLVKDFSEGPLSTFLPQFKVFNGRLYLFTRTQAAGQSWKLWSSDGTGAGTVGVADLHSETSEFPERRPDGFFEHDGRLYFTDWDTGTQLSLYHTDGTPGAVPATRVNLNDFSSAQHFVSGPTPGSPGVQTLYFTGRKKSTGKDSVFSLSPSGTATAVSPDLAYISSLDRCGDGLVFIASLNSSDSTGIWKATGAVDGSTALVTGQASIQLAGIAGDSVYYSQTRTYSYPPPEDNHSFRRLQLPAGEVTVLQEDLTVTPFTSLAHNGTFFFFGYDEVSGTHLWQTRGTLESTSPLPVIPYNQTLFRQGEQLFVVPADPVVGPELFTLDLAGRLEISHITGQHGETEIRIPASGGVVDLGSQYVSYQSGSTLILRNTGRQALLDVAVPVGAGAFTVEPLTVPRLEPGEHVLVGLGFMPQATGPTELTVTITGTHAGSGQTFSQTVTLRGTGLADQGRPLITRMPDHRIVRVGEPLMYQADYHSALPLTKQVWQRGSKTVATTSILNIPGAQLQDAGLYTFSATNAAGTTKSSATILVVVAPIQETLAVPEDGVLTLKATVAAPAGSDVTYQWLRGGTPLSDFNRVRGSRSATLTVSGMSETDTGPYECAVALTTNGQTTRVSPAPGVTVVSMLKKPVFLVTAAPPSSFAGQEVNREIIVLNFDSLTVKGLPAGLKMSPGGLITGRATKAGVYPVTFTAKNASGPRVHTLPWTVVPALPAGVYDGLISQDSGRATETQLGSRLMMIATSTGTLSCRFVYEGRVLSFAGIPAFKGLREDTTPATVLSEFNLIQGGTQPTLTLRFESGPQGILLLLKNGETLLGSGSIYRTRFYATGTPATGLVGNSTWHSQPEVIAEDTPQGHGYAVAAITQDGMVYFQGRLADGTAVLGSSPLLKNPMDPNRIFFCFRHYLYPVGSAYTGTYGGEVDLQPEGENSYRLSGALDWQKAALPASSKERNYKNGIPLHSVFLFGSTYVPPASGKLVWNLTAGTGNGSFAVAPAGGNIAQGILDIGAANKVTLPPVTEEMPLKTLTFDVRQGIFKGTLLFLGETAKLNRTVTFEGALDSLDREGNGAFLLPDLPADGTTLATSPLRSGAIQIRAEAGE